MKRLLILLLLVAIPVDAGWYYGGGLCDQVQTPTEDGASAGTYGPAAESSYKYFATKFVYTGTTRAICQVDLWLSFVGTNAHTYYVAFFSHDGVEDDPDAVITNGTSDGQDLSGIGGSEVAVSWTFSTNPTLTNGTTYWVVIYSTTADINNYARVHFEMSGTTERIVYDDDGAGTWTVQTSAATLKFKLYSY